MKDIKNNNDFNTAESTVFSKPAEHNDRPTGEKRKKLVKLFAVLAGLALLAGVVYSVVVLIPEKQEEPEAIQKITAYSYNEDDIDVIEYTTGNEAFTFSKKETPDYNESGISWLIDGLEEYKQEKLNSNAFAKAVLSLEGVKMQDAPDTVYGFDNPVSVIKAKGKKVEYTITLGNQIDNGRYAKLSGDEHGVYRLDSIISSRFTSNMLAFASHAAYPIVSFSTDVSAYKSSGGMLERFDSLTLSGKNFSSDITFVMNTDDVTAPYSKYLIQKDGFYAQNVDKPLSVFTDTLFVSGAYSYTDDEQALKDMGLDNPDVTLTLNVGGEQKWFRFVKTDDEYCAVVSDDRHVITKVKIENIPFWDIRESDYYYAKLVPFGITDIVAFTASGEEIATAVSVSTNDAGEVTVTANGKPAEGFEDFFNQLTMLTPDFSANDTGAQGPCASFVFTLKNGSSQQFDFYKKEGSKYAVKTKGVTAQISATAYSRTIRKLKAVTGE